MCWSEFEVGTYQIQVRCVYCLSHLVRRQYLKNRLALRLSKKKSCLFCKTIFIVVFTRYKTIPSQLIPLFIVPHNVFIHVDIIYLRLGLTSRFFFRVFRLKLCVCTDFVPSKSNPNRSSFSVYSYIL